MESKEILMIVNDLTKIHNLIVQDKLFSAGYEFGVLHRAVIDNFKKTEFEENRKKNSSNGE
jgi:hypothetical protein